MLTIRQITTGNVHLLEQLTQLLTSVVDDGASVGFFAPLDHEKAVTYWANVFEQLGELHYLWVALLDDTVVGSVQLVLSPKDNGRHRAEVQKLLVQPAARGQHIATKLMATLEDHARALGRTVLVLDTEKASKAEAIYEHLGWQRVGEIPKYAVTAHGDLIATVIFYKHLSKSH